MITVVIPACNEERVIGRLLAALTDQPVPCPDDLEILVVCNGCTDRTAEVARTFADVQVLTAPEPSKQAAMALGDTVATGFPRIYLDADVVLDRAGALTLAREMLRRGLAAAGPGRRYDRRGLPWFVRWYYDVWQELPHVRTGLFGRGTVALSREGHQRVRALPPRMSDDLIMSSAFAEGERGIVEEALVTIRPPRTWGDLVRRRTRAVAGTVEVYSSDDDLPTDSRTSVRDLVGLMRRRPVLALKMPVFLLVTVVSRRAAARAGDRGQANAWLRDESSRSS
jgi:glycosyltransferase involved in cell wall biosynthesis